MNRILSLIAVLLVAVPLLGATAASAQQGAIIYERAQQYQFEIPEQLKDFNFPTESLRPVVLLFTESESLMTLVPEEEVTETAGRGSDRMGLLTRLKLGSGSRSDLENILETYRNVVEGTVVQSREFMGRTFRIASEQPTFAWKLSGEESEFIGYTVQKATAVKDSTTIEAWFALDIPVMAGPDSYGGLPGAILLLTVNQGQLTFKATEVSLTAVEDGVILQPTEGDLVSPDEYERVVEDKLKELSALRRNRSGQRRR